MLIDGFTVIESGHGPAILLIHGGSNDGSAWSRVVEALPADLRTLRYDRYPYRTSPVAGGAEALDHEVDDVLAIHLREIVGGPTALLALMKVFPPVRRAMSRVAAGQIADDEALESLGAGLDRYRRITTPVLLLGGAKSPAHLRRRLAALAEVLPTVDSVVIMATQGHIATLRSRREVAGIIAEFARRVLS